MRSPGPVAVPLKAGRAASVSRLARVRHALQRALAIVRRIIGVPDYETYLAHMRRHYPQCTPLDPATFERERLNDRYRSLGSRCC
ncbi:MAG: YbdD/YjiX family protein [Gemmatimonas sp.]|uniref:YbdD/YjiX family protein n=1 Tax=Gemmatimonas sp. TaxID=1962908 RepID=UPI00391F81F9